MKALDAYNEALEEIYNYFGFKEDWAVFPIDDNREMFWRIINEHTVRFSKTKELLDDEEGDVYENEILHHRFYPKAIYEGPEYTMIMVDTHTDGNKFLQIFDNSKRV